MIGIIMLNTQFPRFIGDIGNCDSFFSPPIYRWADGANVNTVVSDGRIHQSLIDSFVGCARQLESEGATVIGTSCGFLASAQKEIQQQLDVPFVSSSLVLISLLKTMFGDDAHIGVLTFDATKLGPIHFNGHFNEKISIFGLDPNGKWYQCIARNEERIEQSLAMRDAMEVARRCLSTQPDTKALVLECTNLSPWKSEMRKELGIAVFDLVDALQWIDQAL